MAENTGEKQSMEATCVNLLKSAKSDNEKLAGLLIVPKLFEVTSSDNDGNSNRHMDQQLQKDLLEAIDFNFLKRMLSNKNKADSTTDEPHVLTPLSTESLALKSAALNVIACFGEEGVFNSSQIAQIILSVEEILVSLSADDDLPNIEDVCLSDTASADKPVEESDDTAKLLSLCMQCLENFARNQEKQVIEDSLMPSLYRLVVKQSKSSKNIWKLLRTT